MKKRVLSVVLAIALTVCFIPSAWASPLDYLQNADSLKKLGLFLGSDAGFELERAATRAESAVMVVRLLGKETLAKTQNNAHPFKDVPAWAGPYVGYLYKNGITKGLSADRFGSGDLATAPQYASFLLRSLGYSESAGDFTWDKAVEKLIDLKIIGDDLKKLLDADADLKRGYVVALSHAALFASIKGSNIALLEKLYLNDSAVTSEQLTAAAAGDAKISELAAKLGVSVVGKDMTAGQVYDLAAPSVFVIVTKDSDGNDDALGSGFFIDADGTALTNYHVISTAATAKITTTDKKTYDVESVLGYDSRLDIAIIKIKGTGFKPVTIGDLSKLKTGDKVFTIGNPAGLASTISEGILSADARKMFQIDMIQFSSPITHGSSGGVLMNSASQVVGITTGGLDVQGFNFAVPITYLDKVHRFDQPKQISEVSMMFAGRYEDYYHADEFEETEPDNSPANYKKLTTLSAVYCSLSDANDVDGFSISLKEDSHFYVRMQSHLLYAPKIVMKVVDSKNTEHLKQMFYPGKEFSIIEGFLPKGDYNIVISANDPAGTLKWDNIYYDLYVDCLSLSEAEKLYNIKLADFPSSLENDPNDTRENAQYLRMPDLLFADLDGKDDVDYYYFTVTKSGEAGFAFITENRSEIKVSVFKEGETEAFGSLKYVSELDTEVFSERLNPGSYFIKVERKDDRKTEKRSYAIQTFSAE